MSSSLNPASSLAASGFDPCTTDRGPCSSLHLPSRRGRVPTMAEEMSRQTIGFSQQGTGAASSTGGVCAKGGKKEYHSKNHFAAVRESPFPREDIAGANCSTTVERQRPLGELNKRR